MQTLEQITIRKVTCRLIPLIAIAFFINFIDRTNIGIASLEMNKDLGISASAFGFGAGLFFLAYFFFEVPSNLVLERFGARRWIARIMVTWGLIAGGMAFIQGETSFYVMRALLGAAEAGFFPGMLFYLTNWYPEAYRGRAMSYLVVAAPVSFLIGGPISGALLGFDGAFGLRGWQWIFIIEAVPAVIMAGIVMMLLTDRPSVATWLSPEERDWLVGRLAAEQQQRKASRDYSVLEALVSPRILLLALVNFNVVLTVYGVGFFLPQIVKGFGVSNFEAGFISSLPFLAAVIGILWAGRRSDARKERRLHTVIPILIMAVALVAAALLENPVARMAAFSAAAFGAYFSIPPFWALPTAILSGAAAAGGIALINSIGNLGGFAGPWLMGLVKDATGHFTGALLLIALLDVVAAAIVLALTRAKQAVAPRQVGSLTALRSPTQGSQPIIPSEW